MSTGVSTEGTSRWSMGTFQAFYKIHVLVSAREAEKVWLRKGPPFSNGWRVHMIKIVLQW